MCSGAREARRLTKAEIRAVLLLPEADPEPPWLNGFVEQLAAQGLEDLEALATLIHVSTTITGLTRTYNPQDIDEMDECDVAKVRYIMRGCGNVIGVHSSRFFGHLAGLVDAQKVAHATKGQRTQHPSFFLTKIRENTGVHRALEV